MQWFQFPPTFDKRGGEVLEQLGMAWGVTANAKVAGCANEAATK